ncbi:MAG: hypothetical protein U0R44_04780 [Candidatus Micrarchaeia archaeon]
MGTYDLTADQYAELMKRLGRGYTTADDAMAHHGTAPDGTAYMYSQAYIVQGNTEEERIGSSMRAVSGRGAGSLGTVQVQYRNNSPFPTGYSVTTTDPRVEHELRSITGRQAAQQGAVDDRVRAFAQMLRSLTSPQDIGGFLHEIFHRESGSSSSVIDQARIQEFFRMQFSGLLSGKPPSPPLQPSLSSYSSMVSSALSGSVYYTTMPTLSWDNDPGIFMPGPVRDVDPGIHADLGRSTGFMRDFGPGGSTVYIGDRPLYTELPIYKRNPFHPESSELVGRARIGYDHSGRPNSLIVYTDDSALRAILQRANIPVSPLMPQPRQQEGRRTS